MAPADLVRLEELLLAFLVEHATAKDDPPIAHLRQRVRSIRTRLTRA